MYFLGKFSGFRFSQAALRKWLEINLYDAWLWSIVVYATLAVPNHISNLFTSVLLRPLWGVLNQAKEEQYLSGRHGEALNVGTAVMHVELTFM